MYAKFSKTWSSNHLMIAYQQRNFNLLCMTCKVYIQNDKWVNFVLVSIYTVVGIHSLRQNFKHVFESLPKFFLSYPI